MIEGRKGSKSRGWAGVMRGCRDTAQCAENGILVVCMEEEKVKLPFSFGSEHSLCTLIIDPSETMRRSRWTGC
jgi:hypothetical protein